MTSICLNMIVKNESRIIDRCIAALVDVVDCYVICDTGSTDDTVERIEKRFLAAGIPGEIHHTEFRNFAQARNEALDAAYGSALTYDYLLMCDADMELVVRDRAWKTSLTAPAYSLMQRSMQGGLEYGNIRMVRRDVFARYVGVTHEYLDVGPVDVPKLTVVDYLDHAEGSSRFEKFDRDVRLLTEALQHEPDNARYAFYLANSYFDAGNWEEALGWYRKRAAMGGWVEEVFMAKYRAGICYEKMERFSDFYRLLLETGDEHPDRAEPLHVLAIHAQRENRHRLALWLARIGLTIPKPGAILFVEAEVYEWRLLDIVAVSLYWLDQRDEAALLNKQLLNLVPPQEKPRILENLAFCGG